MNPAVKNLADKLALWSMAKCANNDDTADRLCREVYKLAFKTPILEELWDQTVLLRLVQLFDAVPPDQATYGRLVASARERAQRVTALNRLFYEALDGSVDGVLEEAINLGLPPDFPTDTLRTKELSDLIRGRVDKPSERLSTLLPVIRDAFASPPEWLADAGKCLEAIKDSEATGKVNSLLIHRMTTQGIVVSLNAIAQDGTGSTRAVNSTTEDFVDAIDRARLNLVKCNFMPAEQDAVLMGDVSDASYSGSSIALGAAIALYSSRSDICIDPYTAFTGDIKPEGGEWCVRGVQGLANKLLAARELGCRRVFLPVENVADIPDKLKQSMHLVPVHSITEVIACLQLPSSDCKAESLQVRKVRALEKACAGRGWSLSAPHAIQDASQFTVSPPTPPELKIAIYTTGAHTPRDSDLPEFTQLLECLNDLDAKQVPLQPIQKTFILREAELREQVHQDLLALGPTTTGTEAYCDYVLRFDMPPEKLVIKQFSSGKLNLSGRAGATYQQVLEIVVTRYTVHNPNAKLDVEQILQSPSSNASNRQTPQPATEESPPLPYIGTDESGKGDYFGPLVVAAVWIDETLAPKLEQLGIRDSKTLSDKRCKELAQAIREICRGSYEEVEIVPERYNDLYAKFKKERKTLNHLLAWGHARALETLLTRRRSKHAVADQFGDEGYIRSKLMERGKAVNLRQSPKAERFLAVAAASVLARDRFLARLERAGQEYGVPLPKGASPAVVEAARTIVAKHGAQSLEQLAKTHFKTTVRVLASPHA